MKKRRKGQSSFEYLILVGIVFFLAVIGGIILLAHSAQNKEDSEAAMIQKAGNDILSSIEKVYYAGGDSWETLRIVFPESVKDIAVPSNSELVIIYESQGSISSAVFFSDVNITTPYASGSISISPHPGMNVIRVTSYGSYVNISEVP